jgi:hypothetical protein
MTRAVLDNDARPNSGRAVALAQGGYYLLSGLWPIVHLGSFIAVTGPKTDYWLVQSFGALIAAIGAVFLVRGSKGQAGTTTRQFGLASASALTAIDVRFVATGTISVIYLADAAAELLLVIAWLWPSRPSRPRS